MLVSSLKTFVIEDDACTCTFVGIFSSGKQPKICSSCFCLFSVNNSQMGLKVYLKNPVLLYITQYIIWRPWLETKCSVSERGGVWIHILSLSS